jgi:hypothetical protein
MAHIRGFHGSAGNRHPWRFGAAELGGFYWSLRGRLRDGESRLNASFEFTSRVVL